MIRVKRGYIARKRRTKNRLFTSTSRGAHSRLTRIITQQKIKAEFSAHQDRGMKKIYFRRLWIPRINAVTRENELSYNYNGFIHDLYKRQLLLNRKILAQIAISNPKFPYNIYTNILL